MKASYSAGSTSGVDDVGGLVGSNSAPIFNSYSAVNATGTDKVGGLIGNNQGGKIENCYSKGIVSGTIGVGGLIGINIGEVIGSYYDKNTAKANDNMGKGIPKTTAEMMKQSTFESQWDFDTVWTINEGFSYSYLQWE